MSDSITASSHQEATESIKRLFNDLRKKLVETGTRNRLIHVNRSNSRGNFINIVNEQSDAIFNILSSRKSMRFKALGNDDEIDVDSVRLLEILDEQSLTDGIHDNFLETRLGPDALQKRLLKMAKDAQTAEEEQGVNILYLALGFLTWYEDKTSAIKREAPLILLPVELVRNSRTSTYDVKLREEEILTNLPLQKRLRDEFGVLLPEVEVEDGWSPSAYFQKLGSAISTQSQWSVDHNGIQLGFFSFSKLLMFQDLAVDSWPNNSLVNHALTRGLLYEGFESEGSIFNSDEYLDDVLPPSNIFHVVDADASQAKVIEEVRSGLNLVVQGPPGTGKSQTIANIIASAVKEGKKVLFVAEKMAALSVVHSRLVNVGLRDTCLELHSRSANKKAVLSEIARTLNAAQAVPQLPQAPLELTATRDKLNSFTKMMHAPLGVTDETVFSVLARQIKFIGNGEKPPTIHSKSLLTLTKEKEKELVLIIEQYGETLSQYSSIEDHPFSGVQKLNLQPVDMSRLDLELQEANRRLATSMHDFDSLSRTLGYSVPCSVSASIGVSQLLIKLFEFPAESREAALLLNKCPDTTRIIESLNHGLDWRSKFTSARSIFKEEAFENQLSELRGSLVAGTSSFFARWGSKYRIASKQLASWMVVPLPKRAEDRVNLLDQFCHVVSCHSKFMDDRQFCSDYLKYEWRDERTDFDRLLSVSKWLLDVKSLDIEFNFESAIELSGNASKLNEFKECLSRLQNETSTAIQKVIDRVELDNRIFGEEDFRDVSLHRISSRLSKMAENIDRYFEWESIQRNQKILRSSGLSEIESMLADGTLNTRNAVVEFRFSRAEALWKYALETIPELREMGSVDRHKLVGKFSTLDRSLLEENVRLILSNHLSQVPTGAVGEMGVIRGEIGKKKSHYAIRKLFRIAPKAIQRIKPVLLMSPISVAQYLTPGVISFDLLVIDEASQVKPEDSLGAIARAKQIVVVGDKQQLPPSSFFDRLVDDDATDSESDSDENLLGNASKASEMESILTLCEARGLNARMLEWHYRSRDPSLIRVSNSEFYKNGLILPPSPLQDDPNFGLCFTRVDGVYDRGGKRDNRIEGEAVVARIAQHARTQSDMSLGVVTFSAAQKNLITELLELARRHDPVLDSFLSEGKSEDIFVKNIENVQGDERDVIIVSVCYGPTVAGGALGSMNFGPVSGEGGERRLNVLFTRARTRCEVFASFDPSDIVPARAKRDGARVLKKFLDFAKSGITDEFTPTGEDFDSPFEEDVAEVIRNLGYLADPQVGSAGFRIDLGIRHRDRPETYILAVECDGAAYHSALWARERDRLRQDVLEHLGWQFHRIWSTDWFYNRAAEIERLKCALEAAYQNRSATIKVKGANLRKSNEHPILPDNLAVQMVQPTQVKMPPYVRANFSVATNREPHQMPMYALSESVLKIIEIEGPIHTEEVARRLATCFGKEKAGSRILELTKKALEYAKVRNTQLVVNEHFWLMKAQLNDPRIRNRENESGATLKANYISYIEINAALELSRNQNAGGTDEDIFRSAAQLLGFKKLGPDLKLRFASALSTNSEAAV